MKQRLGESHEETESRKQEMRQVQDHVTTSCEIWDHFIHLLGAIKMFKVKNNCAN